MKKVIKLARFLNSYDYKIGDVNLKSLLIIIFCSLFSIDLLAGECFRKISKKYICKHSIIEVLANPEKYNGDRVLIGGVISVGFEINLIFLDSFSYENRIKANAIRLELPKSFYEKNEWVTGEVVFVEGTLVFENKQKIRIEDISNIRRIKDNVIILSR